MTERKVCSARSATGGAPRRGSPNPVGRLRFTLASRKTPSPDTPSPSLWSKVAFCNARIADADRNVDADGICRRAKPKALARGRRKESRLAGKARTSRQAATGQEEDRVTGTIHRSVR